MSESALDRTARALDLVPYLLEHQGISIPELAEAFGVSEKQINDDLVLIHMCGLPGYTPLELIDMFYEDGYVTVSDPQSFKKPRSMNKIEMTSLLVSLDLLKSLRTDDVAKEIEALKLKLQENMRFENPFVVVQNMENTEMVEAIERAIAKTNVEALDSSPIELVVSKAARNFIEDNRAIIGHVEVIEDGEQLLIELNPIDREWLVRTILGFGGQIEVSKPKDLALEVVSRARAIKESYRS